MRISSPRLVGLLKILLREGAPVSVDTLAGRLDTSRRTVFRELENVDTLLAPFGLRMNTVIGRGLALEGPQEGKGRLIGELIDGERLFPGGKQERRLCLALALLGSAEVQKLYCFADQLGVSEATISHDLDALEPWLTRHGIALSRKPGQGVSVEGGEASLRRALSLQLMQATARPGSGLAAQCGYPPQEVEAGVMELLSEMELQLDWMTSESLDMLAILLMVAVDRLKKHCWLPKGENTATGMPRQLAERLAGELELRFPVTLSPSEREAIARGIRSCRAKQQSPFSSDDTLLYSRLQNLTYRIIERFDPALAPTLKMDEQLVQGLTLHLWSAVPRLEGNLVLPDPLQGQLEAEYPELYEKSRLAAAVLEEELGHPVAESEISFLATHFGAAVLHRDARYTRKKKLRVGILCVGGIGVSYIMASQVRAHFKGELEVEISDINDKTDWAHTDFLISTLPLPDTAKPVVEVSPLLTREDYQSIRRQIDGQAFVTERDVPKKAARPLLERLGEADSRIREVRALLEGFDALAIPAASTFEDLAKFAGYRFGNTIESGHRIFDDLMARESISTQVIRELGIVLLHTRTDGVIAPVVALISPENGAFSHPYFSGATSCLVMLLPRQSSRELPELLGSISSALIEDGDFLRAVQRGDYAATHARLDVLFSDYLGQYLAETLKG